jgi:hypothetical protein
MKDFIMTKLTMASEPNKPVVAPTPDHKPAAAPADVSKPVVETPAPAK